MVISYALQALTPGEIHSVSTEQRNGGGVAGGRWRADGFTGAGGSGRRSSLGFSARTTPRPAFNQLDFMGAWGWGRMCLCYTSIREAILLRSSASLSAVVFPGRLFCVNLF